MSASNFLSLSNKRAVCQCPTSTYYPVRQRHVSGAQDTQGTGDINSGAKFRFKITHAEEDSNRNLCRGLFSETLEHSSSRRGMPIVNTAARRQVEETLLSPLCLSVYRQEEDRPTKALHHV